VDNIQINFTEIGWGGMNWIDLAQDREWWMAFVNTGMKLRVPYDAGKFSNRCTTGGFSRGAQLREVSLLLYETFSDHSTHLGTLV
jgi:hypothetical protein